MPHKFDVHRAAILDSPERRRYLEPGRILDTLGLNRNMVFADLGCGTGFFTVPASSRVRKVYALDIQPEMLAILRDKIQTLGITNTDLILSKEASLPLPDHTIDMLFMADVFHELEDRGAILKEIERILAPGGKMVILDWKKVEMEQGPPLHERLSETEVSSICTAAGFMLQRLSTAGPYNYLLVFSHI